MSGLLLERAGIFLSATKDTGNGCLLTITGWFKRNYLPPDFFVAQASEISEPASQEVPQVGIVTPGKSSQGPQRCRVCSCRDTSCAKLDK
jgi:hypothetical protein